MVYQLVENGGARARGRTSQQAGVGIAGEKYTRQQVGVRIARGKMRQVVYRGLGKRRQTYFYSYRLLTTIRPHSPLQWIDKYRSNSSVSTRLLLRTQYNIPKRLVKGIVLSDLGDIEYSQIRLLDKYYSTSSSIYTELNLGLGEVQSMNLFLVANSSSSLARVIPIVLSLISLCSISSRQKEARQL